MAGVRFSIVQATAYERPVALRLPFRFGAVTLREAPQAFAAVDIRLADGTVARGVGAELMVPKWFDKSPPKSNERNLDDLRAATLDACAAYVSDAAPATAFGHCARHYASLIAEGTRAGRPPLASAFGGALLDRAVMDALCRALALPFITALQRNAPGVDATLAPDLAAFAIDAFLRDRTLSDAIAVRHTVGMLDPLAEGEAGAESGTLGAITARDGYRYFKLKLGGNPGEDIARLRAIAAVLDALPDYRVTLDGNEQYRDADDVVALVAALQSDPRLRRLAAATLYLEQPMPRDITFAGNAPAVGVPLLIDEADDAYDAWPRARALGYTGVSSKSCKGLYKSIVNAMRCAAWNGGGPARYFLSGEDLTTQAGLALQQDTALAAALGIVHVERNGHHYVDGFAGEHAPEAEWRAFAAAHPDLYDADAHNARVAIRDGRLSLRSLGAHGFASAVHPALSQMQPMRATARTNQELS